MRNGSGIAALSPSGGVFTRHIVVAAALGLMVASRFAILVGASTGPIPLRCDRAGLEKVMDDALAAIAAHDPKRVPLSADVKYTENSQAMPS